MFRSFVITTEANQENVDNEPQVSLSVIKLLQIIYPMLLLRTKCLQIPVLVTVLSIYFSVVNPKFQSILLCRQQCRILSRIVMWIMMNSFKSTERMLVNYSSRLKEIWREMHHRGKIASTPKWWILRMMWVTKFSYETEVLQEDTNFKTFGEQQDTVFKQSKTVCIQLFQTLDSSVPLIDVISNAYRRNI